MSEQLFQLVWIELPKLLAQLGGAILVAWLAVGWALKRFKAEKIWERRMVAYIEALSAIGEMERITGNDYDRTIERREVSEEIEKQELELYSAAKRKLADGIIAARLVFPEPTSLILAKLEEDLQTAKRAECYESYLDSRFEALRSAKNALIEDGRKLLQLK